MQISSFVALGDSFTEGLDDPREDKAGYRGWADRFAEMVAVRQPGLRYANLAVRGKVLRQVAEEQVPQAIAMSPDLVTLAVGGNDLLRPSCEPDDLMGPFEDVVRTLLSAGCQVAIFTGFDPRFPVLRLIRGRVAAYNMHLRAIAERHGCPVVDLWGMTVLRDPRAWGPDRLHLTPGAHHKVALRACEILGIEVTDDWREPWPPGAEAAASGRRAWLAARQLDMHWARRYAAPWVARRVRGTSAGDGVSPKRPELLPL